MDKERIVWLDVLKLFGIFAIYLGHMQEAAGYSYQFVFYFHAPLFFFASGCAKSLSDKKYSLRKSIKSLLVPWLFFALLVFSVYVLQKNCTPATAKELLIKIGKGCIRNQFVSASLWFLTCLFVVELMFGIIKLLKKPAWIMLVCICIFFVSEKCMPFRAIAEPQWWFNIDSALYYLIWYGLGYVSFRKINDILKGEGINKRICIVSGCLSFLYSVYLFFGKGSLQVEIPVLAVYMPVLTSIIIIWFFILLAYLCRKIPIFEEIGKDTLYLCGNEYIVKALIPAAMGIAGLEIKINTPLQAWLYTAICLIIAWKVFTPIEKKILTEIQSHI